MQSVRDILWQVRVIKLTRSSINDLYHAPIEWEGASKNNGDTDGM